MCFLYPNGPARCFRLLDRSSLATCLHSLHSTVRASVMMCESEMGGLSWLGPVQRPVHQAHDTLHVIFGSLSHLPGQGQTLRFLDSPS